MSFPHVLLSGLMALVAVPVVSHAQALSVDDLIAALRRGGHIVVMRHAASPRQVPGADTANPDNVNLERQLDPIGRRTALAMGDAIRALAIPIGEVLSSPTYRGLETAKMAGFDRVQAQPELGDRGRGMQGVTEDDAGWLRQRASRAEPGSNTWIVTHQPNISGAFPGLDPEAADGEALVFRPGPNGSADLIGRIRIEEWPDLR